LEDYAVTEHDPLIEAARQARENAHAPFSNFRVGAALHATSGRIFGGCNVENATYRTDCLRRARLRFFKAMSEGERGLTPSLSSRTRIRSRRLVAHAAS
jgi:cytidine deaminase